MPKINLDDVPEQTGTIYPPQYAGEMDGRSSKRLGPASGLTQFGVNIVTLAPGAKSSLRHWHENQDEFAMVTQGNLTLIDDGGETALAAGDCCAFPKGDGNAHHIVNQSGETGAFLVVGTHTPTECGHYADIDMKVEFSDGKAVFTRKDGTAIGDTP
jgi:uncharacterized cupin superfamily protein